ncbi:ead/Ea22-like family protein [Citrobacter freundii]|nr:ead/Ea22-like family protein [Citrobacter freundii]
MSNIDKQALRERYSLQPVPKCHICDTVMTIARASAGAVMYACSGCTYDDNGAHYAPGRSLGDDHYSASRVTIFESGDHEVLALLDELEADKEQIKTLESRNRRLEGVIDAAEKRIAETSGQKRLIGWRASDYTDETSDPELAKNWAAAIGVLPIFEGDVNTKLTVAGIGVKGE